MFIPYILSALLIGQTSGFPMKVSNASGPTDPLAWTVDKWTGNDAPFERARVEIDNTKLTPDLIDKYKAATDQRPTDALARFRWGYAYYQAWKQHIKPFSLSRPILWMSLMGNFALGSYKREPLSHSYQYMRLMFLMTDGGSMPNDNAELVLLGRRLLLHTPHDFDVEYHLAGVIDAYKSPALRNEALGYAQDLLHRYPGRAEDYRALGGVYFWCWYSNHNKKDAEQAIAAYQEYLRLAQPDDLWRQQAERDIEYAKTRMNNM